MSVTRFVRGLVVVILALAVVLPQTLPGSAQEGIPPIMPLGEIRPGMRGVGRTTVKGQTPSEFNFEIVAILKGGGGIINVTHLILIRTFGPLMEASGGTAAGMSGSPLYINGKLIGANSASYRGQTRKDLSLATPIEQMLPLFDLSSSPAAQRPAGSPAAQRPARRPTVYTPTAPLAIDGVPVHRIVVAQTEEEAQALRASLPGTLAFRPASPVSRVTGLSPRAYSMLRRAMRTGEDRMLLQTGGGGQTNLSATPVRGGSPVGVLLVTGDVEFGGLCTATLRVGSKVLICGHAWDHLGSVAYGLTSAEVVTVVRTLETPFLEFNLGGLIGQIDEDRGQGIRGVLGRFPRMFVVRVQVTDADTGRSVTKTMQVVRRADLARLFTPLIALTAAERGRDQELGEGTARVKMILRAGGLAEVITRENIFYSSQDVALASVLDISTAMQFLFFNPFAQLDPFDLRVEVTVSKKRETAAITSVVAQTREVSPGDSVRIRITIRPFQENTLASQVITIPIPRNFPRGPAVLVVGSAGLNTAGVALDEFLVRDLLTEQPPFPGDSLEEAVDIFENFGTNDQILIQLLPFGLPTTGPDFTNFDVFSGRLIATDWVIQGEVRIPILVR
ncbi:MAG: hypothetical protein ACRDF5_12355 [bacterium]